jgi:hypothetical protein
VSTADDGTEAANFPSVYVLTAFWDGTFASEFAVRVASVSRTDARIKLAALIPNAVSIAVISSFASACCSECEGEFIAFVDVGFVNVFILLG